LIIMKSKAEKGWLLLVTLFLGVFLVLLSGGKTNTSLDAENQIQTGSDSNITVVPLQIARDSYGLAMIDHQRQTLWIYEINSRGPIHSRLKLLAARSWKYDKFLQDYNTSEPKPEQVKLLLQELGKFPENIKSSQSPEDTVEITEPNSK